MLDHFQVIGEWLRSTTMAFPCMETLAALLITKPQHSGERRRATDSLGRKITVAVTVQLIVMTIAVVAGAIIAVKINSLEIGKVRADVQRLTDRVQAEVDKREIKDVEHVRDWHLRHKHTE